MEELQLPLEVLPKPRGGRRHVLASPFSCPQLHTEAENITCRHQLTCDREQRKKKERNGSENQAQNWYKWKTFFLGV